MNSKVCLTELHIFACQLYWQAKSNDNNNNITYIYKRKQEQHKKAYCESAANIKFTCKLYLVAIYILLNWKIMYHSDGLIACFHIATLLKCETQWNLCKWISLSRTVLCRSFEVSVSLTKICYLLQVLWSTTQWSYKF